METHLAERFLNTPDGEVAERILRACVHCGFCTATCPTYQILGDEQDSPRGRIYLMKQVLEGATPTLSTLRHLDRCLTCRNCESTCPSGVHYSRLLDIGRRVVASEVRRPRGEAIGRSVLHRLISHKPLFDSLMKIGRVARPLLPAALQAKIPRVHVPIGKWPTQTHARKILMLNNCVQEGMLPAVDKATARVLDRLGIQAIIERKSGCCGSLPYHMDDEAGGLADVRRNIDAWWPHIEQGLEAIVINISGCSAMVKDYGYLMRLDPAYAEKAARISAMTFDLSEWLARELGSRRPKTALPTQRLVFHPPCTLQHAQKIRGVVEAMLTTWGAELQPIQDSHLCCGSAGAYSVLQPELSQKLRSRKLSNLERHQPEVILSANVGCIGHLGGGTQTPVMHWIEWMEQRLLAGGVTDERIEMPEMAPDTHEEGASVRNTLKATAITRPGREAAAEKKTEKKAAEAA